MSAATDAARLAGQADGWTTGAVQTYATAVLGLRAALTWWLIPCPALGERTPRLACVQGDGSLVAGVLTVMAQEEAA